MATARNDRVLEKVTRTQFESGFISIEVTARPMPVDKRKVTIKTLLMAVAMPLVVFGSQMVIDGQTVQGGVVVIAGVAAAGVFVAFQEYDVPYESEIRAMVQRQDITTEDVKGLTEEVSRQVDDRLTAPQGDDGG